jgi:hypothetical protein
MVTPDDDFVRMRLLAEPCCKTIQECNPSWRNTANAPAQVARHVALATFCEDVAGVDEEMAHRKHEAVMLVVRVGNANDANMASRAWWQVCARGFGERVAPRRQIENGRRH